VIFFSGKNSPFCYFLKKVPSNLWSRELSGNFPKKSPDFKEESHENIKIFGGFAEIFLISSFEIAIFLANRF
jgi:hypothetical protein